MSADKRSGPKLGGDLALVVRRLIRAPVERVFAAWTEPAQLMAWWGPDGVECPSAEIDLRVGGQYRIANKFPDGSLIHIAGHFTSVEPPRELRYTWRVGDAPSPGDLDDAHAEQVTVRFEPRDKGTQVVVIHQRIATAAASKNHEQGWLGCLDSLEAHFTD